MVVSLLIATQLKFRMVPFADRDQFAVEIYLRPDTPLERTGAVADSVYRALRADERVKSVTSFVGCSSPRFQMSYAPQIAGKNYAQFIVNTTSVGDTEAILDEYADASTERGKCLLSSICEKFGFDSLGYQSLDGVLEAIGIDRDKVCTYCWNGKE